jgi:predicted nucleic acid-binding protein
MKPLLVDTNIASILFKPEHARYTSALQETEHHTLFISFMTKAELLLWPTVNSWGERRRQELLVHLDGFTALLPDDKSPQFWADVMAESRRLGRPMSAADAWIAATAMQWELPLVTNNVGDFEHHGQLTLLRI